MSHDLCDVEMDSLRSRLQAAEERAARAEAALLDPGGIEWEKVAECLHDDLSDERATTARLRAALEELERLHPDDTYGDCVTCFQWNTDESHQKHPCATLQAARRAAREGVE